MTYYNITAYNTFGEYLTARTEARNEAIAKDPGLANPKAQEAYHRLTAKYWKKSQIRSSGSI